MTYMLRKISLNKWESNKGKKSGNHSADAITGCTRTHKNTLSIWQSNTIDFNDESVKEIIVALATTLPRPDTIDVLWLRKDWLIKNGLEVIAVPAKTKYTVVNERHRDIANLDHAKLGIVSEHIVDQLIDQKNVKRIKKSDLVQLVAEWIKKDNTFLTSDLSDYWTEPLENALKKM